MSSGPIQRLTRVLVVMVTICVLGLVAGIVLVSVENAQTNRRLSALEEYVQGKGEQRDRENARLREQQQQGMCDLLDQLPAGGLLERPRAKYGCGPGIPLSELTPEEQARVSGVAPASASAESPGAPIHAPAPSASDPGQPPPTGVPTPPTRQPSAPRAQPLTSLVCALAGVCLTIP